MFRMKTLALVSLLACISCAGLDLRMAAPASDATPEFGGKVARSYAESEEWWADPVEPAPGSPNVIIFLLDDTGFAQIGSFGGLIETPNIDALAENGLRYQNFHTTALCSPTRASLPS